jgi:tRNA G18 (ribose-2'-O)-methylase SpoU
VLPLETLLDNVRSAFNVGSILRSADAAGLRRVHLCGVTPTPAHPRVAKQIAKTALGAEQSVPWAYAPNALDAARALCDQGTTLWALEEAPGALSLFAAPLPAGPLALVVGSEVAGVDPGLLSLCACAVCLPMRGIKRSLNVAVAFGIAAVLLAERLAAATLHGPA